MSCENINFEIPPNIFDKIKAKTAVLSDDQIILPLDQKLKKILV